LVDLVEDDVDAVLRRNQPWLLPIVTASSALLARSYEAPDGFGVEVLGRGAAPSSDDVPARGSERDDPLARRARFLAWPASRSLVIRTPNTVAATRLDDRLRPACSDPESALALVVNRRMLERVGEDERLERVLSRLAEAQKRLAAADGLPVSA